MNASELYNIVKDVPREAGPEWHPKGDPTDIWDAHSLCFCAGYFQIHACAEGHPHPQRGPLPPAIAVMLFEASMMRWLVTKFETVVYRCPEYGNYTVSQDGKEWGGPSLIEALAAACKAVAA